MWWYTYEHVWVHLRLQQVSVVHISTVIIIVYILTLKQITLGISEYICSSYQSVIFPDMYVRTRISRFMAHIISMSSSKSFVVKDTSRESSSSSSWP